LVALLKASEGTISLAEAKALDETESLVLTIAFGEHDGGIFDYEVFDAIREGKPGAQHHPLWSWPEQEKKP
jgi:hypothetical protein